MLDTANIGYIIIVIAGPIGLGILIGGWFQRGENKDAGK